MADNPIVAETSYPLAITSDPEGAAALQASLETLPGVEEALIGPEGLRVRFDAEVVSDEEILATLQRSGYESPGHAPA
jgi:copper chaperone CopZ